MIVCSLCNKEFRKNNAEATLLQENIFLREKVFELTQLLLTQEENQVIIQPRFSEVGDSAPCFAKAVRSDDSNRTSGYDTHGSLSESEDLSTVEGKLLAYKVAQMKSYQLSKSNTRCTKSPPEVEKGKMVRSKRRECLTWRNKAQSWLSKMEKAGDKLLEAEASYTKPEYLEQLRLFLNKLSLQGKLIETAEKASLIYLVFDCSLEESETEEILRNVNRLQNSLDSLRLKIAWKLNALNKGGRLEKHETPENSGHLQNAYNTETSKTTRSIDGSESSKKSLISIELEHRSNNGSLCRFNQFLEDLDKSFREPVFV